MDKKEKKDKKKKEDTSDKSEASSSKEKKADAPATPKGSDASKPWDPLAQLTTEDQRKAFAKMKENLSNVTDPERKAFCTDAEIIRYLKARDFDVSKSEQLLRDTLEWRFNTYKPHLIDPKDSVIAEEIKTGKNYVSSGRDRAGRPILYMKPRYENTKNYKEQLWLLAYHMEKSIRAMDESKGITQWAWIMDFKGFSVSNSPPFSTQRETMDLLGNRYPERLGLAVIVNAPFYFTVFFSAIKPFIPAATLAKIVFVKSSEPKKIMAELAAHITPENLEADYGGELNYQFKFEEYWAPEVQRFKDYIAARQAAGLPTTRTAP